MKSKILILAGMLLWGMALSAQGKLSEEKWKEFEAQKVAYFTQALELTPEEAAMFWPLYNEMMKKRREQDGKFRNAFREVHKAGKQTEAEEKQQVVRMLENEQKLLDIKKEYYEKLMKVVPAQKVARLEHIERRFHKQLIQKMCREPENHK